MTKPVLRIEYCVPCSYLARATWQAQELLAALAPSLAALELVPSSGGRFRVSLGDAELFSKEIEGRFPETDELLKKAFALLDETEVPSS